MSLLLLFTGAGVSGPVAPDPISGIVPTHGPIAGIHPKDILEIAEWHLQLDDDEIALLLSLLT